MKDLADVLPNRQHLTLPRQMHTVKASVLAPVPAEFFAVGRHEYHRLARQTS
jgi:hypothetical protein